MKYDCEVIQDLLPLYKDSACSVASALAVQEHLKECEKCTSIFKLVNIICVDAIVGIGEVLVVGLTEVEHILVALP